MAYPKRRKVKPFFLFLLLRLVFVDYDVREKETYFHYTYFLHLRNVIKMTRVKCIEKVFCPRAYIALEDRFVHFEPLQAQQSVNIELERA